MAGDEGLDVADARECPRSDAPRGRSTTRAGIGRRLSGRVARSPLDRRGDSARIGAVREPDRDPRGVGAGREREPGADERGDERDASHAVTWRTRRRPGRETRRRGDPCAVGARGHDGVELEREGARRVDRRLADRDPRRALAPLQRDDGAEEPWPHGAAEGRRIERLSDASSTMRGAPGRAAPETRRPRPRAGTGSFAPA